MQFRATSSDGCACLVERPPSRGGPSSAFERRPTPFEQDPASHICCHRQRLRLWQLLSSAQSRAGLSTRSRQQTLIRHAAHIILPIVHSDVIVQNLRGATLAQSADLLGAALAAASHEHTAPHIWRVSPLCCRNTLGEPHEVGGPRRCRVVVP